jgi:ABC-type transport system involved in multi-copper enzyme maturation permease subunit
MTWLVWRQYRAPGAIAVVLLGAFAAVMLAGGVQIASRWHSMLASCSGHAACLQQQQPLPPLVSQSVVDALLLVGIGVPAVLGMLVGAPLVAHELESRTSDFAWVQSVTRTRWLAARIGWLMLAAAACGGAVAALITWWSGPSNMLNVNAFRPGQFDIQGIVPVGYAVFAMALGIAAGTVARRTLPAIAVALGGFVALRLVIADFVRPHYMTAVTHYYNLTSSFTPPGQAWLYNQGAVSGTGQVVRQGWGDLYPALPAACQRVFNDTQGPPSKSGGSSLNPVFSCLRAHGWRGFATYQPASRYWPFQSIETGIFVVLAAALIAGTFVIVRRRDA